MKIVDDDTLRVVEDVNRERIEVLQEENSFIHRNLVIECIDCNGAGRNLYRNYSRFTTIIQQLGPALKKCKSRIEMSICLDCNGSGIVCKYCRSGDDCCDCGEYVEKNGHRYPHLIEETI